MPATAALQYSSTCSTLKVHAHCAQCTCMCFLELQLIIKPLQKLSCILKCILWAHGTVAHMQRGPENKILAPISVYYKAIFAGM